MSFATALTINDGVGDHVFDTVAVGNYSVTRRDASADLDKPSTMDIAHKFVGDVSQSKVRFDRVVEDANGVQGKISAYLVFHTPTKVATAADVQLAIESLRAFVTTAGVVDKLINLES